MIGVGTLLRDNPRLTSRDAGKVRRQPLRVVLDSLLRTPVDARIIQPSLPGKTCVATTSQASQGRIRDLERKGVKVLVVKEKQGSVDLTDLMRHLWKMGVMSVMIEGGAELNASAIRQGVVDKILFFIAPRVIGGQDAKSSIGGTSPRHLSAAIPIYDLKVRRIGPDLLVEGYVLPSQTQPKIHPAGRGHAKVSLVE
jgi:diaminohydroxyphosphoribosylaminopyrimidine deaminase/5-amino-6-(5-phosphoribosylamino)uracil reductase